MISSEFQGIPKIKIEATGRGKRASGPHLWPHLPCLPFSDTSEKALFYAISPKSTQKMKGHKNFFEKGVDFCPFNLMVYEGAFSSSYRDAKNFSKKIELEAILLASESHGI